MEIQVCTYCRGKCRVILVDDGIGRYDYGGAVGIDDRMAIESACCEADVEVMEEWEYDEKYGCDGEE